MNELQRVLAALDELTPSMTVGKDCADAARVIRELAADFEKYAMHRVACDTWGAPLPLPDCTCRFDAAREKWRLEP